MNSLSKPSRISPQPPQTRGWGTGFMGQLYAHLAKVHLKKYAKDDPPSRIYVLKSKATKIGETNQPTERDNKEREV